VLRCVLIESTSPNKAGAPGFGFRFFGGARGPVRERQQDPSRDQRFELGIPGLRWGPQIPHLASEGAPTVGTGGGVLVPGKAHAHVIPGPLEPVEGGGRSIPPRDGRNPWPVEKLPPTDAAVNSPSYEDLAHQRVPCGPDFISKAKSSLDFILLSQNRPSIGAAVCKWMDGTVCRFAIPSLYLMIAASHCCLFFESPMRLCSCAVVHCTSPTPNLVTETLHYFLKTHTAFVLFCLRRQRLQ
jgi:hypothetical protein